MAALSSYTPIATYTVPSATTSYTFSSIPSTYTDLVIIINAQGASGADVGLQFNSDTGSNYSETGLDGNGSAASSFRRSNQTSMLLNNNATLLTANYSWVSIFSIQNYSNSTTYKSVLARANNADNGVNAAVGLWRSTAAITSITVVATNSGFASGATFTLYGIANNTAGAKATGGVISSDSSYFYHSFYATDTFTPTQSLSCDYLVVAGGGGGGQGGGGGGAGGLRSTVTATGGGGSLESALSLAATGYTVTVGAGGAGGNAPGTDGTSGANSVFSTITSTGGGGGGSYGSVGRAGLTGGSGGGSVSAANAGVTISGGARTASPVQGFNGGDGTDIGVSPNYYGGGGGGGAGALGGNGSTNTSAGTSIAGNGGNGVAIAITGSSVTYGGGAGGFNEGNATGSEGGTGGGGNGRDTAHAASAGTANTGGGGGAESTANSGAAGGSGVVIIRYAR
jgi:hypothetical protein